MHIITWIWWLFHDLTITIGNLLKNGLDGNDSALWAVVDWALKTAYGVILLLSFDMFYGVNRSVSHVYVYPCSVDYDI